MLDNTDLPAHRYRQAKDIFSAAWTLDGAQRIALLDRECAGDDELRHTVERLLEADRDESFLRQPDQWAACLWSSLWDPQPAQGAAALPERIGRYRIVRLLGQGGMAIVYEARQDHPDRSVALKVIRPLPGMGGLCERLHHEARILARLQHSCIAQIYDAGTVDSGFGALPFVVMELVDGEPITHHARGHNLDTEARIRLLIDVCAAVEHAHQKGVIHRDLKPANILVTDEGIVKVLDFGVARLFETDVQLTTLHTESGQILGTLAYMSPEQAGGDGDAVDTRSDVYALGVLAYELLGGRPPHNLRDVSFPEAVRVVREVEPSPLGTLDRRLRGDLETVVGKAMAKEKERRYPSASALAADLQRVLYDEPIEAKPSTAAYRLRKFARRHRGLFWTSAAAALALMLGIAGTTTGLLQAVDERDRATVEAETAEAVTRFLVATLRAGDSRREGPVTLREVVDRAAADVSELENPRVRARVMLTLGEVYSSLGVWEESVSLLSTALDYLEDDVRTDPVDIVRGLRSLGHAHKMLGRFQEALAVTQRQLEFARAATGHDSEHTAGAMSSLGLVYEMLGDLAESERWLRQALDHARNDSTAPPELVGFRMAELAQVLAQKSELEEAADLYQQAMDCLMIAVGPDHPRIANILGGQGLVHLSAGRFKEAERLCRQAVELELQVLGPDDPYVQYHRNGLAGALTKMGRVAEAAEIQKEVLDALLKTSPRASAQVAMAMNNLATTYGTLQRRDEAELLFREALEIRRQLHGPDSTMLLSPMRNLGFLLVETGRASEARPLLSDALRISRLVHGDEHLETARTLNGVAAIERILGRPEASLAAAQESLAILHKLPAAPLQVRSAARICMAKALEAMGRVEEAVEVYEEADRELLANARPNDPAIRKLHHSFAGALLALVKERVTQGRLDEADALLARVSQLHHDQQQQALSEATRQLQAAREAESPGADEGGAAGGG